MPFKQKQEIHYSLKIFFVALKTFIDLCISFSNCSSRHSQILYFKVSLDKCVSVYFYHINILRAPLRDISH